MPNHVRNIVKIRNLSPRQLEEAVNRLTSFVFDESGILQRQIINFDKIIPEPRRIEDCSPKYIIPEEKRDHPGLEITDYRDWFNWYEWHVDNWGTKWGAYDCYTFFTKTTVTFVFSTAWSAPEPIYITLAKMGYDLEIKYADENIGNNLGYLKYSKDTGWQEKHELDYKNPEAFARSVWEY